MNKPSIQSVMQRQSDNKSIQNIIDQLNLRLPRQDNLLYIMSIESDTSRNKRGSDILQRLDEKGRYSITNNKSIEVEEKTASFGVSSVPSNAPRHMPVQVRIINNAWGEREEHSCDCYRACLGRDCSCFHFLEQCVPTRCCNKCIEIKNQMLAEFQLQEMYNNMYPAYPQQMPQMGYMQMQPYSLQQQPLYTPPSSASQLPQQPAPKQPHQIQIPTPIYRQQQPPLFPNLPTSPSAFTSLSAFTYTQPPSHPPLFPSQQPKAVAFIPTPTTQPGNQMQNQDSSPGSGCTCKKTRCLKMYCECFSKRGYCGPMCSCEECMNMQDTEMRRRALAECVREEDLGCHCKKTKCDKKYCKCFSNGDKCSKWCTCENCLNMGEELKALRRRSIDDKPVVQEPEPQQQIVYAEPCAQLPKNIQFDLPDFRFSVENDT